MAVARASRKRHELEADCQCEYVMYDIVLHDKPDTNSPLLKAAPV